MSGSRQEPVAITGIGAISGFGVGRAALEAGLAEGRSTIAPIALFDTSGTRAHCAARLADFDAAAFVPPERLRRVDHISRLAIAATALALDDAGLPRHPPPDGGADRGIVLGTDTAGLRSLVEFLDRLRALGPQGASALDFSNTVGNAPASLCGIAFGLRGPNVTLSHKEASALAAVAFAAGLVRNGKARAIVTGGVDEYESTYFSIHDHFDVLARDAGDGEASRPFDRRRNGFVMGAGAFLLVVEHPDAAEARAATVNGRLLGFGSVSSDSRLNAWPADPQPLVRTMREALACAGVEPADVGVVFASANSTPTLDRIEGQALAEVFGPAGVPVVSVKGALGESGAAGAAGLVGALLALRSGVVPPTLGSEQPDPDCPVDVSSRARPFNPTRPLALVNAFARGGTNHSAVVGR